ncbi:hypothetical protein UlMin_032147 [Ulmus minor]
MAAHHTRSNSLPSRQHPLIPEFEEQLCRLKSSEEASSSTSIGCNLRGLEDLHDSVEKLLLLPLNQQALSREQNEKSIDGLLDVCNIAKDALIQTQECAQVLQSIMRRRRTGEMELTSEVKKFLASRKMVKKAVQKAIRNLKRVENKCETASVLSMLREVESITLTIFESLLSFISGPKSHKRLSWFLISKMKKSSKVACEETTESNEFESVEAALNLLISPKMKKLDIENAQNELQKFELCVQDLEEGVESLYRRLIKTRVSLLNILNH